MTTIRNYLSGRTQPTRAVLVTWALRCGVPLDWLIYGTVSEPNTPDGLEVGPRAWNGGQVIDLGARRSRPPQQAANAA